MAINNNAYQTPSGTMAWFVNSEAEALNGPQPTNGCYLYLDGKNLILYARYADNRPMETYDMKLREPPKPPQYVTVEDLEAILDKKFDKYASRFVLKKERNGGGNNGQ